MHRVITTAILSLCLVFSAFAEEQTEPFHAVIVGGGPNIQNNVLQIESHTRFIISLLPPETKRTILFADGSTTKATVSCEVMDASGDAQRAFEVLFSDYQLDPPTQVRVENLGVPIDGPSSRAALHRAVSKLAVSLAQKPAPILFYFAGHGDQDEEKESETRYNMWNNEDLTVRELATELSRLPSEAPVVLVMAQCYSGAFANVLFRDGNAKEPQQSQDIAGFFASAKDREAAGCGLRTDEEEYQDFSSYFFGALSGHDRLNHPVDGADYDSDGRVSFHEAFCYALIHDPTTDTPTCTSDAFLVRFAHVKNSEIYSTSFEKIRAAATPAQSAALDALSEKLELTGDARLLAAYDRLHLSDPIGRSTQIEAYRHEQDKLCALRKSGLATVLSRWPALRWPKESKFRDVLADAMKKTGEDSDFCRKLIETEKEFESADDALEVEEAMLVRFTKLCESIVRAQHVRDSSDTALKARFEHLWRAEQRSLPLVHGA